MKKNPEKMEPIENINTELAPTEISPNAIVLEETASGELAPNDIVLNTMESFEIVSNDIQPHEIVLNEMEPHEIVMNEMEPLESVSNEMEPREIVLSEMEPSQIALFGMAPRKSVPCELSPNDMAMFEMAPSGIQESHECDAISETSNDERRRRWVDFFDRERYRHFLLLMRSKQFAALVELIHSWKRETDPFKPPVELPVPEHILTAAAPAAEEEEVETSQSGKSSNSQATTLSSQSGYTTTKSAGSSYVSVRSIDTRKTNTVALVVLVVSVLVVAGIIAGVVVHLHMDKGQRDTTLPDKELHNYINWITSKEKHHIFQLVNGKFFPLPNRTLKNNEFSKDRGHFSLASDTFALNDVQSGFRANNIVGPLTRFTNSNSVLRGSAARGQADHSESFTQITRGYTDPRRTLTQVTRSLFNPSGQSSQISEGGDTLNDLVPHPTRSYSGDSNSNWQEARSRLNTAGSLSQKSTFSTRRNDEALNTQSDPTSSLTHSTSHAGGTPKSTSKPLSPQRSHLSLSPDQRFEITDSGLNPYLTRGRLNTDGSLSSETTFFTRRNDEAMSTQFDHTSSLTHSTSHAGGTPISTSKPLSPQQFRLSLSPDQRFEIPDSDSNSHLTRSRLNTDGSLSSETTFFTRRNDEARSTQFDHTSSLTHSTSHAGGTPISTSKPLSPQQSRLSLSPDQRFEIPDSDSNSHLTRSRLNTDGSLSSESTFFTKQNEEARSTQFEPASLHAGRTPRSTFKPLSPQKSHLSLSPDQRLEITDSDSNPYLPATNRDEVFSTQGELPGTSGRYRIPEFTSEPMTTFNDRLESTGTSRLLHPVGFEATTMTSSHQNDHYVENLSRGILTQGRSTFLMGRAVPRTTAKPETFSRTHNMPAWDGTWGAAQRPPAGPATTKSPGTLVNIDALRPPFIFITSAQPTASSDQNELQSAMDRSQNRRHNSTTAATRFTASATSSRSSVRGTTSQDMDRPFLPGGTKSGMRPLTRSFRTTTPRTTTVIRTKDLEQFAAVDSGSIADSPDGPSFGGTNDGGLVGAMGMDYDLILKDLPLPEVLPTAIATKVAAAPPALTTLPPPRTPRPPKIKLITNDVVAEISMSVSQGLKVGCMAKEAWGWTYMAISRYEGDHNLSLEFLGGVEKRDEWPFIPIDSRMSDFTLHRDDEMVHLILETKFAMCEDKGRYLCEVNVNRTFFSKTFNVDVKKKPEKPILSFPDDIFAGQIVWITTTWDAGNPMTGHIVHDIVKGFTDLPFVSKEERTRSWYKDCAIIVENKYSVVPELNWNGTEIIARIEADNKATTLQKSIIERVKYDHKVMVILDANMCQGKMGDKLAHPYNTLKFVTCNAKGPEVEVCPELHHFNATLKTCILIPV